MNITQQFILIFSALGAINGFILSGYFLLLRKERRLSDYFLGGLLFMISVRIIKSVFLNFNDELFEAFIAMGLGACALIGPFLYLYVNSMTSTENRLKKNWWWHVLPYVVIFIVFNLNYSYYDDNKAWQWFIDGIYKQWLLYIILSGYLLRHTLPKIWKSEQKLSSEEWWLVNVFLGTTIIWIAYETCYYTSYIVGALSFSFIFYLSIVLWLYRRHKRPIAADTPIKYANSTIDEEEGKVYCQKLMDLMEERKPHLDPELSLKKLSEQVGISSKQLSQVINQFLEGNYAKFIASHRIDEAKELLSNPENQHYKISHIAYQSGFNSLSSFNSYFKKITGMTAIEFQKKRSETVD